MVNQIILRVHPIESHGKLIEYQIKDGRKLIAEIFPSASGIVRYEILMDGLTFYRDTLEEAFEKVRNNVNEFWNGGNISPKHFNTRLKAGIKKGFDGGRPVDVIFKNG
jgi:hypothetical protein